MPETPISLLERLRLRPDAASWERLVQLYQPWIAAFLRGQGLPAADIDDVTQDAMAVLVRELPHFRHDLRRGAFRRWLRGITLNRLRVYWRSRRRQASAEPDVVERLLEQLEDPESDLSRRWDEEHNRHVVRRLLELLEDEFEPRTWQAFQLVTVHGQKTDAAAAELGMSPVAVRIAKSRVLTRLRQEVSGLID
jgi:RNA polymerase sigma factor (sigma-70 family)